MEFWGVEVKPGQTLKCEPGEGRLLHLSQAAIGETKDKGVENVTLNVKLNEQKLVIGTLSADKCAQISYDLVFEKDFELSHSSKNASVHFCGYKCDQQLDEIDDEMFSDSDSEEDEDVQIAPNANGKPKVKAHGGKTISVKSIVDKEDNAVVGKAKAKSVGLIKDVPKADDDDDDEDDSDDDEDDSDDDEDMVEAEADSDEEVDSDDEDDSDDEEDESSEEDDATPKKAANGKKRPAESASKTPVPEKKAKLVTPAGQKTGGDGKKNAHVDTPHPAKQAGKTPANSKKQSPKSGGSANCKPCGKTFNSENALQAHTKAKHSTAK